MNNKMLIGKFSDALFALHKNNISNLDNFVESFRTNQIKSKNWLVEELANTKTSFDKVLVVGSWNGILLYELMKQECDVGWFDFLDIDKMTHIHRDVYFSINNMEKNYNSLHIDATEYSDFSSYDLIINTSCEHMKPLPPVHGPLYALQSNNYRSIKEHINCVDTANQLKEQYQLSQTAYKGHLKFDNYTRFMVIGSHW